MRGDGMRYVLDICERVTKSHRVTIDTDRPIDDICGEIESHAQRLMSVWDIQYLDGVVGLEIVEDEDGESEFEAEIIAWMPKELPEPYKEVTE
jgi:hypothetical protein